MAWSIEKRGGAALFHIERTDRANAFSRDMLCALGDFARDAGNDPAIRALVLTGSGKRFFCVGADLKERSGWSEREVRIQLGLYRSELGALDHCPKPVIAAINGLALGGGLELALACDLRVAAPHAEFALPEVTLGIIPGAGGTQRLTRAIGESRAKQLILFGARIDSRTALSFGLVNRISPPDVDVVDDTLAWMAPLLEGAPLAQAAALAAIDAAFTQPLEGGLDTERLGYERVLASEDRLEGLHAFAQKRKPCYSGK